MQFLNKLSINIVYNNTNKIHLFPNILIILEYMNNSNQLKNKTVLIALCQNDASRIG